MATSTAGKCKGIKFYVNVKHVKLQLSDPQAAVSSQQAPAADSQEAAGPNH